MKMSSLSGIRSSISVSFYSLLTFAVLTLLTHVAVETSAALCLLPPACASGTFVLYDKQNGLNCDCVPCLPGMYRTTSSGTLCRSCGSYDKFCLNAAATPVARSISMCTYFEVPGNDLAAMYNRYQTYILDDANYYDAAGQTRKVRDLFEILPSSYLWGDMRDLRNAQKPCGHIRFAAGASSSSIHAEAPRPGTGNVPFTLFNNGGLPMNLTFIPPNPFLSILTSDSHAATGVQMISEGKNSSFQLAFDSSLVPTQFEWANKSGFSATVQLRTYQYWDQASPRVFEPLMDLTLHVSYQISMLYLNPTAVEYRVRLGEEKTTKVTVMNMNPSPVSWTATIQYDDPAAPFLAPVPGKSLNGSGRCVSGSPVEVKVDEYSSIVDITASADALPIGRYAASVLFSNSLSVVTVRVIMDVEAGIVSIANSLLLPTRNLENLTVTDSLGLTIKPRDAFNQTSFLFHVDGAVDPEQFVFNVTLVPLFDCPMCAHSMQPTFLMGNGYSAILSFAMPGEYLVEAKMPGGASVIGSPLTFTVHPVNCQERDATAVFNATSGSCVCTSGYGRVLQDGPFVICSQCVPGMYSLNGECHQCALGTFTDTYESDHCVACEEMENRMMTLPVDPLKAIKAGSTVDLERDPFDSVPNPDRTGCVQCTINYVARQEIGSCVPCETSQKLRKVVDHIVSTNASHVVVKWKYSCVCKAEFFYDEAISSCLPCPSGAFCLGRTKNTLLPLQGFWKSPWAEPGTTLEKCRTAASCPGVYLEPSVLQVTDSYLTSREAAYLVELNATVSAIQGAHGGSESCPVQFVCDVGFAGPLCNKCDVSYTRIGNTGCSKCIPQPAMVFIIAIGILFALLVTAFIVRRTIINAKEEMEYYGSFRGGSFRQGSFTVENGLIGSKNDPAGNRMSNLGRGERTSSRFLKAFSTNNLPMSKGSFRQSGGGSTKPFPAAADSPTNQRPDSTAGMDTSVSKRFSNGRGSDEVIMAKILVSHLQEASMSIAFNIAWPWWVAQMFDAFNVVSSAGQTLFSLSCLLTPNADASQGEIGGACLGNVSVEDTGLYDPTRPLTFFLEAIFITVIPFAWALVAAIFWSVFYFRGKMVHRRRRGKSAWNYYLLTLIVLVFLLYPTLSRTALRFYSCSGYFSGYRFLEADFNVVCMGPTHVAWMATLGTFMMAAFAIGIPTSIFYVLWKHHRNMTKYRPVFGFVYLGFKEHLYFWECVIMVRKILFSICAVIISPLGSDLQAFCGLTVLLVFLQLQTTLNPYEGDGMNRAESLGLLVRFFTILLGLAISSSNASSEAITAFGVLVILINAYFILFSMSIFYKALRVVKKHGVLAALGLSSRPTGGLFKSESARHSKPGEENRERELSKFMYDSDRQLSVDVISDNGTTFAEVNPVYVNEARGAKVDTLASFGGGNEGEESETKKS